VKLLGNGCLCCGVRTDLQDTLRGLVFERARGSIPNFQRVIVETSGLADPGPVLQTFATDRALGGEFYLRALVAVVDLATIEQTLDDAPEARKQIMLADRIVLTKLDLLTQAQITSAVDRIKLLNSTAPIQDAVNGVISPLFLLDGSITLHRGVAFGADEACHSDGIDSFSLVFDAPLQWNAFEEAMGSLATLRGPDLLRVKGLLSVRGCQGPVVVHFVQHLAHPPTVLDRWPDEDRRSRLVFITRNIGRAKVEKLITAMLETSVG
jgi:G3E family GTPase